MKWTTKISDEFILNHARLRDSNDLLWTVFMFVYSLPLFFEHIHFFSPVDLSIFVIGLLVILIINANYSEKTDYQSSLNHYLFASWSGNIALIWVAIPFFILLNVGLFAADTMAKTGMFTVSMWDDIHLIFFLPIIWWTVSIWRCSTNTHYLILGAFARFLTISVFFEYALKMLIRIDYPRIFFECEELFLDYGNCF